MKKGSSSFLMTLILVVGAASFVIASPRVNALIHKSFKIKFFNFGEHLLSFAPEYDLSGTFDIQSERVANLDSGKKHVEKYMNGFKEEIIGLKQEITGIDDSAEGIKTEIKNYQAIQDNTINEVNEEAKVASADKLDQYQSEKVDVAVTVYEGNVPIQKDIFTHSKELYKDLDDPTSFGILPN